jgi:hypothetical protein
MPEVATKSGRPLMMDYRPLTVFHHCKLPTASGRLRASGVTALVCFGLMALAGLVQAQPGPAYEATGSKYYAWGEVNHPGAYVFVVNPDVMELLSAAGGPTRDANLRQAIIVHVAAQKRTRINLQAMLYEGQVVRLSPGDVLIVPSSAWYYMRDVLSVLTTVAGFVTLYFTIMTWAGR